MFSSQWILFCTWFICLSFHERWKIFVLSMIFCSTITLCALHCGMMNSKKLTYFKIFNITNNLLWHYSILLNSFQRNCFFSCGMSFYNLVFCFWWCAYTIFWGSKNLHSAALYWAYNCVLLCPFIGFSNFTKCLLMLGCESGTSLKSFLDAKTE